MQLCSVRNGSSVSTAVNERGEGTVVAVSAYLCRCTSFPFYDGLLWLHSTDARKGDSFSLFQTITGAQVRFFFARKGDGFSLFQTITGAQVRFFFFFTFTTHFLTFLSTFTIRPSIPSLFQHPTGHESRRFQCHSRIKYAIN